MADGVTTGVTGGMWWRVAEPAEALGRAWWPEAARDDRWWRMEERDTSR